MLQSGILNKMYPHLRFNQAEPLVVRAPSPTIAIRSSSVHSVKSNIVNKPDEVLITDKPVEVVSTIEPIKVPKKIKKIKIDEPVVADVKPIEPPTVVEAVKTKRPNRVKVEPKPEPVRASQVPTKGEQGLQRKYSAEQRKQIYLDRLSRKSVKNAEREVTRVNEVLTAVEHDEAKLKVVEKEVKNKLKLINYAKYFIDSNNINRDALKPKNATTSRDTSTDLHERPKGPEMPTNRGSDRPVDGARRRRGSGSKSSDSDTGGSSGSDESQ